MSEDRKVDFVALDWPSKASKVRRLSLPFQAVETVNDPRVDAPTLFSGSWPEGYPKDWKNKLIWGDNRYVMGSLHENLAAEIDLIYIDPPFATGADFTYEIPVGDTNVTKEPSIIEEIAYRDTWGRGLDSYLQMMYERLVLMHDLLAPTGSIYVHLDATVVHYIKVMMDEIFGRESFTREIIWRIGWVSGYKSAAKNWIRNHDTILFYTKDPESFTFNKEYIPYPDDYTRRGGGEPSGQGYPIEDVWNANRFERDLSGEQSLDSIQIKSFSREKTGFPTQKNESLVKRIIRASSNEGDLVADFFCGSGTTGVAAEKLGRRWIMTDLSKYAVQTSRKRLLNIHQDHSSYDQPARPFQVLNMGNYQKNRFIENGHPPVEEYQEFVLELYNAQPVEAGVLIHGRRANDFIHVASVDSVVTIRGIEDCVEELHESVGGDSLHILGWDFALGLSEALSRLKASTGVDIQCKKIPDEAVELARAEDARDQIKFYDLNYFEADLAVNDRRVSVTLEDFMLANPEFLPEEAREAISDFSDYIDYWAVDFDNHGDTFHNMWQSFRTEEDASLDLRASYSHDEPGQYRVLVKVIDVFGNDTTQVFEVEVS